MEKGLTIESKPTKPDKDSTNAHEEGVVRLEVRKLGVMTLSEGVPTLSEHERPSECTKAASDMDRARTGKI